MNEHTTHSLTEALRRWLSEALVHINQRSDMMAELRQCMSAHGDVRIAFYLRANCITVEAMDYAAGTVAEVFSQQVVRADAAVPDSEIEPAES